MILVCGQNCAWQLTYGFDAVTRGAVNRVREVHRSAAGKGVNVARVLAALEVPATAARLPGRPQRRARAAGAGPRGHCRRGDRHGRRHAHLRDSAGVRQRHPMIRNTPNIAAPAAPAGRHLRGQPARPLREAAGHDGRSIRSPPAGRQLPDEGPAGAEKASCRRWRSAAGYRTGGAGGDGERHRAGALRRRLRTPVGACLRGGDRRHRDRRRSVPRSTRRWCGVPSAAAW